MKANGFVLITQFDPFGSSHTQRKRGDREDIMQRLRPVAAGNRNAEQHHIAGLRVGEHPAAAQIGVHIKKAACKGKQRADAEGFGHLRGREPAFHKGFPLLCFSFRIAQPRRPVKP